MHEVTRILNAIDQGDPQATEKLLPLVYDELRKLAAQKLAQEKPGQTFQPTALVHEAYLRLVGVQEQRWNGRAHFFGAAAEAMRRILIENARRKAQGKRGGSLKRVELADDAVVTRITPHQLLELEESLGNLESKNSDAAAFSSSAILPAAPWTRLQSYCRFRTQLLIAAGLLLGPGC